MKQISSRITYFHKRVFPVLWFGFFLVAMGGLVAGHFAGRHGNRVPLPMLLMPLFMLGIGGVLIRFLIAPLADEVWDSTEFLLVRKGEVEERIFFTQIRNVSYQNLVNPPRVTLSLRDGTRLGREISFIPQVRYGEAFRGKNPVVEDLIERVDAARRNA